VLYVPDRPEVVSPGEAGVSFLTLIRKRVAGWGWMFVGQCVMMAFFAGWSLLYLKAVTVGPRNGMVE